MSPFLSSNANLAETLERAQAERQALGSTAYPHKACNRAALTLLLNTQVGQGILACVGQLRGQKTDVTIKFAHG